MTQQAHLSDAFSLANGVAIPCLGYGTWRMQDGDRGRHPDRPLPGLPPH